MFATNTKANSLKMTSISVQTVIINNMRLLFFLLLAPFTTFSQTDQIELTFHKLVSIAYGDMNDLAQVTSTSLKIHLFADLKAGHPYTSPSKNRFLQYNFWLLKFHPTLCFRFFPQIQ